MEGENLVSSAACILRIRRGPIDHFLILKNRWTGQWSFPTYARDSSRSLLSNTLLEIENDTNVTQQEILLENVTPVDVVYEKKSRMKEQKYARFFFCFLKREPSIRLSRNYVKYKFVSFCEIDNFLSPDLTGLLHDKKKDLDRVFLDRQTIF